MSSQIFEKTKMALLKNLELFVALACAWVLGHAASLAPQFQSFSVTSETRGF